MKTQTYSFVDPIQRNIIICLAKYWITSNSVTHLSHANDREVFSLSLSHPQLSLVKSGCERDAEILSTD